MGWLHAFVVVCVVLDQSNAVSFNYGGIKESQKASELQICFSFCSTSCSFHIIQDSLLCVDCTNYQEYTQTDTKSNSPNTEPQNRPRISIYGGLYLDYCALQDLSVELFWIPLIIVNTPQRLYAALVFVFTSRINKMYNMLLSRKQLCCSQHENANTLLTVNKHPPPVNINIGRHCIDNRKQFKICLEYNINIVVCMCMCCVD